MISTNLAALNAVLPLYQELSGKNDYDILSKQGGKLGYAIYQALKAKVPPKGSIRANLMARLQARKGISIRASVIESIDGKGSRYGQKKAGKYSRGLTLQQQRVKKEIGLRESGRGVLSYSIRYPKTITTDSRAISIYGTLMSTAGIRIPPSNMAGATKYMRFTWSGISKLSSRVARGLQAPRGREAIEAAINNVREDILIYTRRKLLEANQRALRMAVKQ